MADIYDEEYVNRKIAEVTHCRTCSQLLTSELRQWGWSNGKDQNGKPRNRTWRLLSPDCKPCRNRQIENLRRKKKLENAEEIHRKKAEAAAKRQEQRRKQTEERIERQKKESFICKTCGELTPPELHQWHKKRYSNGDERWTRSAHCKPCLSQKSLQNQTKDPQKYKQIKKRLREYKRILQQTNPEKFKNDKRKTKVRRVARQLKQSDGSVTQKECYRILNSRNDCLYCGAILDKENRSLDHLEPLSKGGLHSTANLVVCCRTCNIKKRDATFDSWVKRLPASRSKLAKSVYNKQIGNSKQLQLFTGSFG